MKELLQRVARDHEVSADVLEAILEIENECLDLDVNASDAVQRIEELLERRRSR